MKISAFYALALAASSFAAAGCGQTGASDGGPTLEFDQFFKDFGSGGEPFRAKYPAGKTFALRAKALEDGSCGAAQCGLKLGGGPQAFIRFELAPDQKNVASIKSGQSVVVTCTPVYEPKVMWLGKGCTVK